MGITESAMTMDRGRWRLHYLRAWRLTRMLTQDDLAQRAGISRPTISRAENGQLIYGASVRRIAVALHVQPEVLLQAPQG